MRVRAASGEQSQQEASGASAVSGQRLPNGRIATAAPVTAGLGILRSLAYRATAARDGAGARTQVHFAFFRSAAGRAASECKGMNQELKRQAVALRYEPKKEAAPRLVAKGRGYLAEKIIELARLYDIPIRQDKKLLQILSRLDLEEEIPPEVYKAVAEILAFIYRLSNRPMETSC